MFPMTIFTYYTFNATKCNFLEKDGWLHSLMSGSQTLRLGSSGQTTAQSFSIGRPSEETQQSTISLQDILLLQGHV